VPQRKCAVKDLRKNHTRQMHNLDLKSDLKKAIKSFLSFVTAKNTAEAKNTLNLIYQKLDKAVKTNLLKKNTASRRKSRFARLLASSV
jgi:small subunit ribosomal protein S20